VNADAVLGDLEAVLRPGHVTVGVAESLTGGAITSALAAVPGSGGWLRGGIVAYSAEVKRDLLRVPPGPVVSATAAVAMARGAREVLGADVVIAVTGAGGPEPQDGREPGTVHLAVAAPDRASEIEQHFDGRPGEVVDLTVARALSMLLDELRTGW